MLSETEMSKIKVKLGLATTKQAQELEAHLLKFKTSLSRRRKQDLEKLEDGMNLKDYIKLSNPTMVRNLIISGEVYVVEGKVYRT